MKRLILDYFRRWWWMLALGGALQSTFGWSIAKRPEEAFEFWVFLVALWMGATLLGFDLQRGVARTVASLPLTAKQIGRGWWLATVAIPAIALAALLFLGAGTFHYFHPNNVFPASRLAMASLFVLPWLGTSFTSIYGLNNDIIFGNWRERTKVAFFSSLSTMMLFGGMLTLQNSTKQPFKFAIYLGVGALLIVAGWFRAERFVLGRASFRLSALRCKSPGGQYRAPGGYGGIPLLISTTFVRMFLYVASMVASMALLMLWQGQAIPRHVAIAMFAGTGSFMACGFIIVFQLLPVLRQLRFLRTLPLSATRLATVMIAIVVLPLIALGALATGVAGLALGTQAGITFLKSYTFILASASLCVFFAVWRGDGMPAYALLVITMFGFQQVTLRLQMFFHYPEMPFNLIGPIVAICVLLAFLLTRRALLHSSHAYRVQANPFGNVWGAGR